MKKNFFKLVIFSTLLLLLLLSILFQGTLSPQLSINEVSFQNNSKQDWVEIYNPSINTRSLKGMYMTDDRSEMKKFLITDDVVINPKGFVVIGGQNTSEESVTLKTNFALKNGETVFLVSDNGVDVIDSVVLVLDEENKEKTIGRFPDGAEEMFVFSQETKGERNDKDKLWQLQ